MDFNKLLSKLKSIDPTDVYDPKGVSAAATKANHPAPAVKLDEAAQLRVLSGRSTMLAESALIEKKLTTAEKDKKEEVVKSMKGDKKGFMKRYGEKGEEVMHATATKIAKKKAESVESNDETIEEEMRVGDTKKTAKGGTVTKTATGIKHTKKDTYDGEDHQEEPKKKVSKTAMTGAERQAQKAKDKEQAKASKDYEKKNPGSVKKYVDGKLVKEAAKPDFLDIDKDGDKKEPMKKAAADKGGSKPAGKKGMSDKQAKYFGKKNESAKTSKKVVAESVESKLTFKDMVRMVQESGGQQQIDPMDKELFAWATRVAQNKLGEGVKSDLYAGLVYERMGGVFEMYNVLAENQK
jgi:hypothetical protein